MAIDSVPIMAHAAMREVERRIGGATGWQFFEKWPRHAGTYDYSGELNRCEHVLKCFVDMTNTRPHYLKLGVVLDIGPHLPGLSAVIAAPYRAVETAPGVGAFSMAPATESFPRGRFLLSIGSGLELVIAPVSAEPSKESLIELAREMRGKGFRPTREGQLVTPTFTIEHVDEMSWLEGITCLVNEKLYLLTRAFSTVRFSTGRYRLARKELINLDGPFVLLDSLLVAVFTAERYPIFTAFVSPEDFGVIESAAVEP